jgi:hypothetical protein
MALVHVNGHLYWTQSVRLGDRVTSLSYGRVRGEDARLMVAMDRIDREERQAERIRRRQEERERSEARREARRAANEEIQALRQRLDSTDRVMTESFRMVGKAVEALLQDLGFHRHDRGPWQRRRTPMYPSSPSDTRRGWSRSPEARRWPSEPSTAT